MIDNARDLYMCHGLDCRSYLRESILFIYLFMPVHVYFTDEKLTRELERSGKQRRRHVKEKKKKIYNSTNRILNFSFRQDVVSRGVARTLFRGGFFKN